MKFSNVIKSSVVGLLLMSNAASGAFLVEQWDDYWSSSLANLQSYEANNSASSFGFYDVIDFTDDPAGFAGEIPGSSPWPSADQAGAVGTGHALNNTFFAKISGDINISAAGMYDFRTFNDDGVFLLIDDVLVINDPTLHPEQVRVGSLDLSSGLHAVELYFFENGGEASLEFTFKARDAVDYGLVTAAPPASGDVPVPATLALFGLGLLIVGSAKRKLR